MPTELRRFFQRVLSQYRPQTRPGRRSAFSFGRSSEPLEIRRLLSANLGNQIAATGAISTTSGSSTVGQERPDNEWDPAQPPADVTGSFLTSTGLSDTQPFSYNDVFQQGTDDCVFMASLSAVARTNVSLSSHITLVSKTSTLATYNVTLYRAVGSTFVTDTETVTYNGTVTTADAGFGDNKELWPVIYQRGYLQFANKFGLDYHDYNVALSAITGNQTYTHAVNSSFLVAEGFKDFLDDGTPEIAATYDSSSELINAQWGIVANHAYTIIGIDIPANNDLSKTWVSLRNPWGEDTSYEYYTSGHNGIPTGDDYVTSLGGVDGSDDGLIRIPWSVFSSSFQTYAYSEDFGPSINTPLPAPVKFDPVSSSFTIYEGQPLSINFHAVDPGGHTVLYWSDVDQPGNIHPQTGNFTYTPNVYGDEYFQVYADAGPYTSATIGFVVHVLPASPVVTATTVTPTTLHDDGSDLITLKSTVTVPYGQIDSVAFYSDANNNGTYEPDVDPMLGYGQKSGNNYSWSGYVGGLTVGQHNFFVIATRYDHDLFRGYAVASAPVVAATHADPVAIPVAPESMFTTPGADTSILRTLPDAAGNLYVLIRGLTANGQSYTQAVGKFDSAGNLLNATTVGELSPSGNEYGQLPDLVVLADGSFAVVWEQHNSPSFGSTNIVVQWFNSDGTPSSTAKTVVTGSAWAQNAFLNVAGDANANLLIVYNVGEFMADDVWAVSVARNGTITRAPWMVNSHTANSQKDPEVALNANGDGVIVWTDLDQGILMGRKVSASGVSNGSEFNITTTYDTYSGYDVAVAQNGDFYIATISSGVYLQKFSSAAQPIGTALKVNTFGGGTFFGPNIALSSSGWLAVGWANSLEDGNNGGFIQILDPSGIKFGPEFSASNTPTAQQGSPLMVMNADANLATFWSQSATFNGTTYNGGFKRFFTVDLPPTFDPFNPFSIPENSPANTVVGTVHAADPDPGSSVSYSLQSAGAFQINATTGQITVASGAVLDYETQPSYLINVLATSGTKTTLATVKINLTDVSEPPTLTLGSATYNFVARNVPTLFADPVTLADPTKSVFTGGYLTASLFTNGTPSDKLSFSAIHGISVDASNNVLLNGTTIGTLASSGLGLTPLKVNLNANATLTAVQTLLSSLQFQIVGTPSSFLARTISFSVNDGQLSSASATRVVTITDNTAPVLNVAGDPAFPTITEDLAVTSNPGMLIKDLIASMAPLGGMTDPDAGFGLGIALDTAASSGGTWQYSLNNGTTWTNVGTVSQASALLLASDAATRLRFLPSLNFNGDRKIYFSAWDQSTGSNSAKVDASVRGTNTAFSLNRESATITVTPVNDAPVLNAAGNPVLTPISQNVTSASNTGTLVTQLIASMSPSGGITDVDASPSQGIAVIGANQTSGTWQYATTGANWVNFGTTSAANALLLAADATTRIRFVPNAGYNGTVGFTFLAWDQTDAAANGTSKAITAQGTTTPFSTIKDNAFITVNAAASPAAIGVVRNGGFYLDANNNGTWNSTGDSYFTFGNSTDIPLTGDWNGDGKTDIGTFRNGTFFLDLNGNHKWDSATDVFFTFGNAGDKPITGDWNGDGKTDVGTFRNGTFFLDQNGSRKWESASDVSFAFGNATDIPVTGDWNGDGKTDVGTFRNGTFFLDQNGSHKWEGASDITFAFGNATDLPVTGDWNGDGKTDVGTFRNGTFYLDQNGNHKWDGATDKVYQFGSAGDKPIAGIWAANSAPASIIVTSVSPTTTSPSVSTVESSAPSLIMKIKTHLLHKLTRTANKGKHA